MNVSAFIKHLNKTRNLQLDADYYGNIEIWRQWWKGDVPDIHDQKEDAPDGSVISRRLASLRMPKHVCEDWANLLLNDKTTLQIGDTATSAYLLGSDEQQTGGLLRQLHFWENANRLVEQAYWSGTGAFVMSVENLTVDASGNALPSPQGSIRLDYDPACCILPIGVERGVVTEAAFVSECLMDGKPAIYLQTHTGNEKKRTIRNEWFRVIDSMSGTPVFSPVEKPPEGTVESITVSGSPAWFSLFGPAAAKNIDGGMGLGMSIFSEALDAAQMVDYAFDNYRQDIRLGGKKIFYDRSLCRKWVDKEGTEHAVPPDAVHRQIFYELPTPEGGIDQPSEYHEYNPDLRVEQNHRAVQDMLNLFSFKCGLGCHRYDFENGKVTTATEYNGSRQDLVASANKNQIPIEGALIVIIRAILWAAKDLQKATVVPDTPISVNWDDSYITDAETRMTQMRDDALSGLLPRYKYLSARYGISEEDARRLAEEARTENRQPELTFGGGA